MDKKTKFLNGELVNTRFEFATAKQGLWAWAVYINFFGRMIVLAWISPKLFVSGKRKLKGWFFSKPEFHDKRIDGHLVCIGKQIMVLGLAIQWPVMFRDAPDEPSEIPEHVLDRIRVGPFDEDAIFWVARMCNSIDILDKAERYASAQDYADSMSDEQDGQHTADLGVARLRASACRNWFWDAVYLRYGVDVVPAVDGTALGVSLDEAVRALNRFAEGVDVLGVSEPIPEFLNQHGFDLTLFLPDDWSVEDVKGFGNYVAIDSNRGIYWYESHPRQSDHNRCWLSVSGEVGLIGKNGLTNPIVLNLPDWRELIWDLNNPSYDSQPSDPF